MYGKTREIEQKFKNPMNDVVKYGTLGLITWSELARLPLLAESPGLQLPNDYMENTSLAGKLAVKVMDNKLILSMAATLIKKPSSVTGVSI